MVLVRTLHNRNANIVVEANGEVLFAPTGDVGRWTSRFSHRVRNFSASFAPTNKRPRWAHYGKPLKSTFTSSTRFQPGRMKVHSAVGSSSPHAYYVDQGTGVYNESAPYPAKILPPWTHGSASLYEHTWRPGGGKGSRQVAPVMIKGQKGQGFFDKGLKRGFESMRMRSFQVPGEGQITKSLSSFPEGLANFVGNTPASGAFIASLTEWRAWRDAAWARSEELGRSHRRGRTRSMAAAQHAADAKAAASQSSAVAKAKADLAASKKAAADRLAEQKRKLAEEKKRREEGRRKREAADKKRREELALRAGNEKMRREANEFYRLIRKAHPEAVLGTHTLPDGVIIYQVTYTLAGETVRQRWAYGYAT